MEKLWKSHQLSLQNLSRPSNKRVGVRAGSKKIKNLLAIQSSIQFLKLKTTLLWRKKISKHLSSQIWFIQRFIAQFLLNSSQYNQWWFSMELNKMAVWCHTFFLEIFTSDFNNFLCFYKFSWRIPSQIFGVGKPGNNWPKGN